MKPSLRRLFSRIRGIPSMALYQAKVLQQRSYRIPGPEAAPWSPLFQWFVAVLAFVLLAAFLYVGMRIFVDALMYILPWGMSHSVSPDLAWTELRNRMFIVAALLGAPFLVWRTVISAKQTKINEENHYTSLFTKAVELLGSTKSSPISHDESPVPNIELRVGSIYSLERIARDSESDYWPIIETISGYVRANGFSDDAIKWPDKPLENECQDVAEYHSALHKWKQQLASYGSSVVEPRADIQAALRVIGRRSFRYRKTEAIHLGRAPDLSAVIAEGGRLRNLDFGRVDFSDANLSRSQFHLADLSGAHFFNASLVCTTFFRADLSGAQLPGANLQGSDCSAANLRNANLSGAALEGAELVQVRGQDSLFMGAQLDGCMCHHADFAGANFEETRMVWMHGAQANFRGALLTASDLRCAYLAGANFNQACLRWCKLPGTNFYTASLREADFEGCALFGCMLFGADLTGAKGLDQELLNKTLGDMRTVLPSGLVRPESWHKGVLEEQLHGGHRVFVDTETKERYPPVK